MEDQFDWALWEKTRTPAILASVWARWTVQVHTSLPRHSSSVLVFITKISLAICSEAQSSVTERPLTAGVWTRTVERLPEPDRMTLSNLHVSPLNMISCMCPCVQNVENLNLFLSGQSCPQAFLQLLRPQCAHCPAQMWPRHHTLMSQFCMLRDRKSGHCLLMGLD